LKALIINWIRGKQVTSLFFPKKIAGKIVLMNIQGSEALMNIQGSEALMTESFFTTFVQRFNSELQQNLIQ